MKRTALSLILIGLFTALCFAQDLKPGLFSGAVTTDNINIRTDSNTNSKTISTVSRGEVIEVVLEKYDWYKIRLPKTTPAFIRKNLLTPIDAKTAKVSKDSVNIRQSPSESAPIIGKAENNEILAVLEDKGDWYRIVPNENSFGWIHKKFVNKTAAAPKPPIKEETIETLVPKNVAPPSEKITLPKDANIFIEGVIEPYGKVLNRIGTHKLITKDYETFFLKGNTNNLNSFTYHKVKISGKLVASPKSKYPIIEITKMEALD